MKKLLSIILACSMLMSLCFVGTVHAGWEWVDFHYTFNFDDGKMPEGWVLYNHPDPHGMSSTVKVQDGALVFDGNGEWFAQGSYLVFEDLGIVKREGLKVEFDVKKTGPFECENDKNNAHAGFFWNATVADGAVTDTAKAILYTENTTFAEKYQRIKAFETNPDVSTDFTVADLGAANLRDGGTINVKANFELPNRSAAFKINDMNPTGYHMYEGWPNSEGMIGLTVGNSEVTFDNIVISGKRWAFVPDYTTTLDYEKGAASFSYEENFDDLPNGSMPEGFKLIKAHNDEGSTLAVQNGALEFYANNPWACTYVAFENLGIVKRDTNLVIEMDLRKISGPKHEPGHAAQVGAAWTMAVEDGYKGSHIPVTGTTTLDAEDTNGQKYYQREINPNDGSPYDGRATNLTGGNLASGEVVKVKYVFSENNRNPKMFFNGVESNDGDHIMWKDWTANEGYVGLCGMNGKFAIDNIKITGYNYGSGSAEAGIEATTYKEYAERFDTYKDEAGVECYTSAVKAAFNVSNMKNALRKANVWFAGANNAAVIPFNTAIESAKAVEVALNVRYVPTNVELTVEKIELN